MASKKPAAFITLITPAVTAVWPKVNDPDYGTAEYPKPEGQYVIRFKGEKTDPAIAAFIKKMQPFYDKAQANAEAAFAKLPVGTRKKLGELKMNPLYATVYDKETEEETGEVEFKFTKKASGITKAGKKWSSKPVLCDALGRPITTEVGGGSLVKISFEFDPEGYFIPGTGAGGLSLKLKGVQVLRLVQFGAATASSCGFGVEEGYEGIESAADETEESGFDGCSDTDVDEDADF